MVHQVEDQDPFSGILDRSSIAQALRDARASLARPSRPFTPASRSLFQQADDPACSRPSSSYSIDQLKFVSDTFAAASESMVSTRSTLRSRTSDSCTPIPESGELEEPEFEVEDIAQFGNSGEIVAECHTSHKLRKFGEGDANACPSRVVADEEEYDGGAADDLALCMDVPPPGTDEEESEEEDYSRCGTPAGTTPPSPAGSTAAERPKKLPGMPKDSSERSERPRGRAASQPGRRKSDKKGGEKTGEKAQRRSSSSSSGKEWSAGLRQVLSEIEASAVAGPGGLGGGEALKVEPLAERLRDLVAELRGGRCGAQQEKQASKALHAVLTLMDRKMEPACLVRLARCALDLLRTSAVLQDVGGQGVGAAYLNVVRALFKLSKDSSLDAHFKEEGLVEPLLSVLGSSELHCMSTDLRVFVVGVLKNITNNDENQKYVVKRGALPTLQALLRPDSLLGSAKEVQLLIQVTALMRNLVASGKRQLQFVELGLLSDLMRISALYTANEELQVNISRILGKLSMHDKPCEAFAANPGHVRQVVRCLQAHQGVAALVLRLSFVLGNLAAKSEQLRDLIMLECDGAGLLAGLLERYWRQDRKLAQAEAATHRAVARLEAAAGAEAEARPGSARAPRSSDAQDCESVLVKLVRLAANSTISASVGTLLASNPAVVDPLLDILGCKRMPDSEELVLSTTAAVTNLLFYDTEANLLFTAENKQLLCRLLRPMLLESYNVEALVEAARALGNLSRHQDARQWISELRIDEVLCILLAHDDRDLVFYACGALVNLAADPAAGRRLCQAQGLRPKLAALLRDAPAEDSELLLVAVKVLSNLRLDEEGAQAPWPEEELTSVRAGLVRACELPIQTEEASGSLPAPCETLSDLAGQLLKTLPLCEAAA